MEDNRKNRVDKNKQWSVQNRGCNYFIDQMHVTRRTFKKILSKNVVCKSGNVELVIIIPDSTF